MKFTMEIMGGDAWKRCVDAVAVAGGGAPPTDDPVAWAAPAIEALVARVAALESRVAALTHEIATRDGGSPHA